MKKGLKIYLCVIACLVVVFLAVMLPIAINKENHHEKYEDGYNAMFIKSESLFFERDSLPSGKSIKDGVTTYYYYYKFKLNCYFFGEFDDDFKMLADVELKRYINYNLDETINTTLVADGLHTSLNSFDNDGYSFICRFINEDNPLITEKEKQVNGETVTEKESYIAVASNFRYTLNGEDWFSVVLDKDLDVKEQAKIYNNALEEAKTTARLIWTLFGAIGGALTFMLVMPLAYLAQFYILKHMGKAAVKVQKSIIEENKEDLKDVANASAEISSEAITKTTRAVKKGLEDKIYCKHCGDKIDADSKFCNSCGKKQ